ncbi:hypothetical protein Dda_4409 [Drechslerella dactyloides]|uniref:Uncharacterized protein n=1 Tax=Drechslerella dactyloides TaxID=74499 RepID=A0AAD6NJ91_DREDA|nr:hypothetical protein Dda_4409 [Drechslerella dactyloides]
MYLNRHPELWQTSGQDGLLRGWFQNSTPALALVLTTLTIPMPAWMLHPYLPVTGKRRPATSQHEGPSVQMLNRRSVAFE